jgi:hypothetical protein
MPGVFPHPDLTPLQVEALTITAEEASEVAQECSKMLRMGPDFCRRGRDVSTKRHFSLEIVDLMLLVGICDKLGLLDDTLDAETAWNDKIERLAQWSNLADVARGVAS